MMYKVGDKVRIAKGLLVDEKSRNVYGIFLVTESMKMLEGRTAIVESVYPEFNSYKIDIHPQPWWHDSMLEQYREIKQCKFMSKKR